MDAKLSHPSSYIISGSSGCGKTQFTIKLLKNWARLVKEGFPERIVWFYAEFQPSYTDILSIFPQIEFIQGVPEDVCNMFEANTRNLCIIDDLMQECSGDKNVCNLFTKTSHHRNLSVIFITQNLFFQGKESRTISLNAHYIVLFKNPRDKTVVVSLAKQMYPGNVRFLGEAYEDATKEPYGYIFIDLKPSTDEQLRLRTHIFPEEYPTVVYIPKSVSKRK
jgi:hypothetical protein